MVDLEGIYVSPTNQFYTAKEFGILAQKEDFLISLNLKTATELISLAYTDGNNIVTFEGHLDGIFNTTSTREGYSFGWEYL